MTQFSTSLILALWISITAIIAIQNATPVSLQFLGARSVEIPLGLVLAFSAAIGMVGTALAIGIGRATRV